MKRFTLLLLLVLTAPLGAQTLTQTIRGTVLDSESKFPLADVLVVCDQSQVFTDEYGQFSLEVEIGRKVVAAQLFGYDPSSTVVELNSGKQN